MIFIKEDIKFRYLFDIATGVLHDLKNPKNPDSQGCGLDSLENWVVFDTDCEPSEGAIIKKLTATKEVVDIEVENLCPHCMAAEDSEIIDLLKDYFLSGAE